jgi:hypothetical protein
MKNITVKSTELNFCVQIENTTTDAVTGSSWTGNAYGTIMYKSASATNPMLTFRSTGASVTKVTTNANTVITNFVQNPSTGFVGVQYSSPAVGDVITVAGVFVKDETGVIGSSSIGIGVFGNVEVGTFGGVENEVPQGILFQ